MCSSADRPVDLGEAAASGPIDSMEREKFELRRRFGLRLEQKKAEAVRLFPFDGPPS